jgi:putative aldouronate transport system substrate-binding protein
MNRSSILALLVLGLTLTFTLTPCNAQTTIAKNVTLVAAVPVNAKIKDITTNDFTLWLQKETGITLKFVQLSPTDTATQINTLMMSGKLPDVFLGYSFGYAELAAYVEAGFIARLDDVIKKYGKEYYTFIKELTPIVGNVESFVTYNGGIYAVPTASNMVTDTYASTKFRIQEQFLRALGMQMPTSLDGLYRFLTGVRDKDVNGNGNANDEIPITGSKNHFLLENIGNAYQYSDSRTFLKLNKSGKIEFTANNSLYRETVEYIKKLVDEKLLDPGLFTQDTAALLTTNSKKDTIIGVDASYISGNYNPTSKIFADISITPNLAGPYGYKATHVVFPGIIRGLVATTACKRLDVAFQLFDFLLSDRAGAVARLGIEGRDWEKAKPGLIGRDGMPAWYTMIGTQVWTLPSHNIIWQMTAFIHGDVMNHVAEDPKSSTGKLAAAIPQFRLVEEATGEQLPGLIMNIETSVEYEEVKKMILNYVKTTFAEFVLGQRPLTEWAAYCAKLDSMGLAKYVRLSQEAYDAMKK